MPVGKCETLYLIKVVGAVESCFFFSQQPMLDEGPACVTEIERCLREAGPLLWVYAVILFCKHKLLAFCKRGSASNAFPRAMRKLERLFC